MNPKNKQRLLWGVPVAIAVLIALLSIFQPEEAAPPPVKPDPASVAVMPVRLQEAPDRAPLPGVVMPDADAVLAAEQAGTITKLRVDRGDRVKRGDLLLQIDDRIQRAALMRAEAAERETGRTLERTRELRTTGAVSEEQLDRAERAHDEAAAALQEAKTRVDQCRVAAPFDGFVNDRMVEKGEYVSPGTPLFRVLDNRPMKLVFDVPERDVPAVRNGEPVTFRISSLGDTVYTARVDFVAEQMSDDHHAYRVECTIREPTETLRGGMIAEIGFVRGTLPDTALLPLTAVIPSQGEHIVYLIEDEIARRSRVRVEATSDRYALITTGIPDGALVAVEGHRTLSDGQPVRVTRTNAPPSTEKVP
ncbi:efflux RND transporter periplasmic adaptor subunit [Kiritimatiella glycovorans]|uniref:Multidrug transporter MdtA n=1 Tax=Kiritimatiella glycovorans TaxID=1307763 RepID=A0A0G3EGU8_9BACT|nr:efflux RND transporter periplasmic adaptor subunit [Kiritimatiella glycovorans]AKJ64035.1 Multidrug transporter MdtA [Kiritimatiella glycovorans]